MEFKIKEVINEVLNNYIMGQCSLGEDSDYDHDYTQLVTAETYKSVTV